MRIRDRNQAVPGGYYYKVPETGDTVSVSGHFNPLMQAVRGYYQLHNLPIPDDINLLVEEQICQRAPARFCRGGLGDLVASVVQVAAGAVDAVAGTDLKTTAKNCGGCKKRKKKLNNLSERIISNFR